MCESQGREHVPVSAVPAASFSSPNGSCYSTLLDGQVCCPFKNAAPVGAPIPGIGSPKADGCRCTQSNTFQDGVPVCLSKICSPGQASCAGNAVQVCTPDGLELSQPVECPAETTCMDGKCKPWECTPGEILGCALQDAQSVCAANGLPAIKACVPTPDAGMGYSVCVDGACLDKVCVPGAPTCEGIVLTKDWSLKGSSTAAGICRKDGTGVEDAGKVQCASACVAGKCVTCDAVSQCQVGSQLWQFQAAQMQAQEGLAYCADLELNGYSDWRLPEGSDLGSLHTYWPQFGGANLYTYQSPPLDPNPASTVEPVLIAVAGFLDGIGVVQLTDVDFGFVPHGFPKQVLPEQVVSVRCVRP